jgi:hypothetical protein
VALTHKADRTLLSLENAESEPSLTMIAYAISCDGDDAPSTGGTYVTAARNLKQLLQVVRLYEETNWSFNTRHTAISRSEPPRWEVESQLGSAALTEATSASLHARTLETVPRIPIDRTSDLS